MKFKYDIVSFFLAIICVFIAYKIVVFLTPIQLDKDNLPYKKIDSRWVIFTWFIIFGVSIYLLIAFGLNSQILAYYPGCQASKIFFICDN